MHLLPPCLADEPKRGLGKKDLLFCAHAHEKGIKIIEQDSLQLLVGWFSYPFCYSPGPASCEGAGKFGAVFS